MASTSLMWQLERHECLSENLEVLRKKVLYQQLLIDTVQQISLADVNLHDEQDGYLKIQQALQQCYNQFKPSSSPSSQIAVLVSESLFTGH